MNISSDADSDDSHASDDSDDKSISICALMSYRQSTEWNRNSMDSDDNDAEVKREQLL